MSDRLNITRRDFLNGVTLSLAAGTSLSPLELLAAADPKAAYYPPDVTGRAQIGRILIANADSESATYLDNAVDAADRAVAEQMS